MVDLVLPPALNQARVGFKYLDSTGVTRGVYTGVPQTTNYGGDRIGAAIEFSPAGGRAASSAEQSRRGQLLAFLMALRGKTNRAYLTDSSYVRRGSFSSSEMLTNADFSSGTTGWSATGASVNPTLTAADGALRATAAYTGSFGAFQAPAATANAVYIARAIMNQGRSSDLASTVGLSFTDAASITGTAFSAPSNGYCVSYLVPANAVAQAVLTMSGTTLIAGDHVDISFASVARGALSDNPGNMLTKSDEFDHANWTKARCTITANATTAPDGATSMDALIEDNTTNTRYVAQGITATSTAQDIVFTIVVVAAGRAFCMLQLLENTGSTTVTQFFSLSGSGAVGVNGSTGANWANRRASVVDLGSGRIMCTLIARKTNAATSINCFLVAASADGTTSYLGNSTHALSIWRATVWPSSVAIRPTQSTTTTVATSTQTGTSIYLKGLPASTAGLLLAGDWFEVDGQLKMVTAPLNSDAAGLGYLQFSPPLRRAISDNTPIIVHKPMGRFMLAGDDGGFTTEPGIFSNASIELEEAFG